MMKFWMLMAVAVFAIFVGIFYYQNNSPSREKNIPMVEHNKAGSKVSTAELPPQNTADNTSEKNNNQADGLSEFEVPSPSVQVQNNESGKALAFPIEYLSKVVPEGSTSISGKLMESALIASNFSELIDTLAYSNDITTETSEFVKKIEDFVIQSENFPMLEDFKVACTNDYCLSVISGMDESSVQQVESILENKNPVLPSSGFFSQYQINENGRTEIRLIFNSNPAITGVTTSKITQ
jgi:hypothetical protein